MNRPSNTPHRVAVCLRIRVAYPGSGWTGRQNEDDDLDPLDFEGSDDAVSESDTSKQGAANVPEGIVLGPGEGRTIGSITFKATDEQTGGSIGFIEAMTPPGAGPPRHVHYSCDELFYVLEGQFLFLVGEREVNGPPGTFVFIPRGTVHAAKVIGTEPGKVLAAYVPGGQERSFEEFGQLPADVVAEKYDSEFVGPPLGLSLENSR